MSLRRCRVCRRLVCSCKDLLRAQLWKKGAAPFAWADWLVLGTRDVVRVEVQRRG